MCVCVCVCGEGLGVWVVERGREGVHPINKSYKWCSYDTNCTISFHSLKAGGAFGAFC